MPVGVVISSGRALKTIRVRLPKLFWDSHIRKNYNRHENLLVHDEAEACVAGDVVRIESEFVTSKHKSHIVAEIVSAVRTGEVRRAVETVEEGRARKSAKRQAKEGRRAELKKAVVRDSVVGDAVVGDKEVGVV